MISRGVTVTWKVADKGTLTNGMIKIILTERLIWERSSTYSCTQSTIQSHTIVGFGTATFSSTLINYNRFLWDQFTSFHQIPFTCIDFNEKSDFLMSEYSAIVYAKPDTDFMISFIGTGSSTSPWIPLYPSLNSIILGINLFWSLATRIHPSLGIHGYNSAPFVPMIPSVKVLLGQSRTISIPIVDQDGDRTQCRWPQNSTECLRSACNPMGELTSDPCQLVFPVKLIIEDLNENDEPISQIN